MEEPAEPVMPPKEPSLLERIRNMWQFANLSQWIFQFGGAVKIDENLDISVSLYYPSACPTRQFSHLKNKAADCAYPRIWRWNV